MVQEPVQRFTVGQVAKRFGVAPWQIVRLFKRRILAEPARLGRTRMIPESRLGEIEAALRACGYLED
jgi:hypothetical protein